MRLPSFRRVPVALFVLTSAHGHCSASSTESSWTISGKLQHRSSLPRGEQRRRRGNSVPSRKHRRFVAAASQPRQIQYHRVRGASSSKCTALGTPRGGNDEVKSAPTAAGGRQAWWPPWPFNLLRNGNGVTGNELSGENANVGGDARSAGAAGYKSGAELFWRYFVQKGKVGALQLQAVASDAIFHLPPAAPPLILLALLPVMRNGLTQEASFVSIFSRRLALSSLGVSAVSWAHYEIRKKTRLVPLPLSMSSDVRHAVLPPFLPEKLTNLPDVTDVDAAVSELQRDNPVVIDIDPSPGDDVVDKAIDAEVETTLVPKWWQRQVREWYQSAPKPKTFAATLSEWRRMRRARRQVMEDVKRNALMEELIAYQKLRSKAEYQRASASASPSVGGNMERIVTVASEKEAEMQPPLGWALVTGASRGIGRAFAVELARWGFPLILVARDSEKLRALARDLEACYGVRCCVAEADLSMPGAAARLHSATRHAGLDVEVLVNNAGISSSGDFVETDVDTIDRIVEVNDRAVATLSCLYGKDMKDRGRGRLLMVSSITGALPGVPGTAVYAASKAFQKSLALSIGKELEPYGVGVTCLMPGAVRGTAFAERGDMEEALCWKYPFYPKTAPMVASLGVRALLAGDAEVVPGWQNRALVRIFQPMIPQRATMMIAETSWKPLHFAIPKLGSRGSTSNRRTAEQSDIVVPKPPVVSTRSLGSQSPPFTLTLDTEPVRATSVHMEDTIKSSENDGSCVLGDSDSLQSESSLVETTNSSLSDGDAFLVVGNSTSSPSDEGDNPDNVTSSDR